MFAGAGSRITVTPACLAALAAAMTVDMGISNCKSSVVAFDNKGNNLSTSS